MNRVLVTLTVLALAATPTLAGGGKNGFCPPGLAKKSPACIPPGQAKKRGEYPIYARGDRYGSDVIFIDRPERYALPNGSYIRAGDYVFRVNRETQEVLDLIGAVSAILN